MTWIAGTLWDLLGPVRPKKPALRAGPPALVANRPLSVTRPSRAKPQAAVERSAMQDRYDALVEEMKIIHGVRVRKWRKSSSGVAWKIRYRDGRLVKLIEAPYPRGPMSCAIFLHEIGHHVIGLGVYKPRCLEEYHVWIWALSQMKERGFNVTESVEKRVQASMRYAVAKARRRGIQQVPAELHQYL